MTESLEQCANAAAMAGESSAVPFDEAYFDGMIHAFWRGGAHSARDKVRKTRPMSVLWNNMMSSNDDSDIGMDNHMLTRVFYC